MNDQSASRDAVEQLAEEFLERQRRGEHPSITEYADAHPELAERIRRLFPAIAQMEQLGGRQVKSASAPAIPDVLGEYRLIREIGRGGMGVVYEARQETLGRHVALKVLPNSPLANPTFRERFQREARAAARLHHTNIVPVFGVGEHDGVLYYAMQYIQGRGLDAVLRQVLLLRGQAHTRIGADHTTGVGLAASPDAVPDADPPSSGLDAKTDAGYFRGVAHIGLQVAQALDYAHGQGVLHRDIKPSNIIMDAIGTVWVTDFGLAKTQEDDELTQSGDVLGTLRYMAPERFRGESTALADVYALGVTLYELVTMRPAFFETDRARLIDQVLHSEPPAPRKLDRRVPRDLETIVLKAMAREPRDRYASAGLLAEDLQRFLVDRPILARPTPWAERTWRWCRRNPRLAGVTAVALALLLVIAIGSPIMSVRLYEQKQAALAELWSAHLARAEAQQSSNEAGRRFAGLHSLQQAFQLSTSLPFTPERRLQLRNHFIGCLSLSDLGETQRASRYPPGSVAICFEPSLERYALGDEHGNISIRRVADDEEVIRLPGFDLGAWALRFSPDGKYLAAGYHRKYQSLSEKFRVWDLTAARAVVQIESETGCGEADFSADSRWVAFGRDKGTLAIHDLHNPTASPRSMTVSALPQAIAFSPDGTKIAVAVKRTVEVRDVASGQVITTRSHDGDVWAAAWHPQSRLLATNGGNVIYLWDDSQAQPVAVLPGHERVVYALTFSRQGDLLASKAHDNTIRLWDMAVRRQLVRATSVYVGCTPLQFGPNDAQLGTGSDGRDVWLWNVAHSQECRTLAVPNAPARFQSLTGRFSHDGCWLAIGCTDGIRFWDAHTQEMVGFIPGVNCWAVPFRPDSKELITSSRLGIHRWPLVQKDDTYRLGPAQRLLTGQPSGDVDLTPDGRVMVARRRDATATIIKLHEANAPVVTVASPMLMRVALSPDGALLASGALAKTGVKIWNAQSGEFLRDLVVNSAATVRFSPDGRWLAVGTETEYSIWDTATWQKQYAIAKQPESEPADSCFSTDGRQWVIRKSPTRLHMLDPATGDLLAEFPTPDGLMLIWHTLSPDGRYLAAGGYRPLIYVWDLHAVRRPLAEHGVDWDAGAPVVAPASVPARLTIEVGSEFAPTR